MAEARERVIAQGQGYLPAPVLQMNLVPTSQIMFGSDYPWGVSA
jgi:hypothetical protein